MSAGTVTVTPCDATGTWLVALYGDHDLASRVRIREQTDMVWRCCRHAIIDLTDVTFIDSGVIAWLLEVERELEAAGAHTLSIVEGPPRSYPARLFGLLRMQDVVACYPTRAEALGQTPDRHARIAIPRRRRQSLRGGLGVDHAT
jgi:ABC-type transporter Mla MlaB component